MLSEYRELMTKLKAEGDKHFLKLFDEHNNLDTQIDNFEKDPSPQPAVLKKLMR